MTLPKTPRWTASSGLNAMAAKSGTILIARLPLVLIRVLRKLLWTSITRLLSKPQTRIIRLIVSSKKKSLIGVLNAVN